MVTLLASGLILAAKAAAPVAAFVWGYRRYHGASLLLRVRFTDERDGAGETQRWLIHDSLTVENVLECAAAVTGQARSSFKVLSHNTESRTSKTVCPRPSENQAEAIAARRNTIRSLGLVESRDELVFEHSSASAAVLASMHSADALDELGEGSGAPAVLILRRSVQADRDAPAVLAPPLHKVYVTPRTPVRAVHQWAGTLLHVPLAECRLFVGGEPLTASSDRQCIAEVLPRLAGAGMAIDVRLASDKSHP